MNGTAPPTARKTGRADATDRPYDNGTMTYAKTHHCTTDNAAQTWLTG
ncbi:hypothetical protein [Streptomyces sp. GbtcB6]|nr:hypothetical protein [Streptomyces sp. GbtcB6]